MKSIPLIKDIVSKRIDEMADDVENKLINSLRENNFALQIDESIVTDIKTNLLAHSDSQTVVEDGGIYSPMNFLLLCINLNSVPFIVYLRIIKKIYILM